MSKEAMNIATQCRATASDPLAKKILVDGGSGFLAELLLDAAKAIEALAQRQARSADTWVGLTDEEMYRYCPNWLGQADFKALMLHIEAKLKEKNT